MGLIKAKSNGLDLYSHSQAVLNTANIINAKGNFNLEPSVIFWMCVMHDIGKANPLFLTNMIEQNYDNVCRHEISSILFIDTVPENIRDIVAFTILSHHKSIDRDQRSISELFENYGNKLYDNHIGDIDKWGPQVIEYLLFNYGIKAKLPTLQRCREIIDYYAEKVKDLGKGYSYYRGLLMMSDHFSSCFENENERLAIINSLFEIPNVKVYETVNDKYPLSLIKSDMSYKHTLVIAPTGCGKTNFVMKRCTKRIFYILPFQASINAMFLRFKNDIKDSIIALKHSSISSLNFIDDRTKDISQFFGHGVIVMTPFQIMQIIFRLKGYESLMMNIQYQDIIFDELQSYDSKNQEYIYYLIKVLLNLNCNIHVCTATMPTKLQNKILNLLSPDNTQIIKLSDDILDTFNRHIIHTVDYFDLNLIKERYKKGEKILIVRNQVNLAQNSYKKIKECIPNCKIMLIHSRFKRKDRDEKEKLLMNYSKLNNEPCIVVSTQVVEVSLDINFDVMFSDCADIMSLIQRFGRINRQRNNIGLLKDIFVIKNGYNKREFLPYDKNICERTYEELTKYNNKVLLEKNIQSIIDKIHDDNNSLKDDLKYKNITPYNDDGTWKSKMYSNTVNETISSILEFNGYIGILSSNEEEYIKTKNKNLEIPISGKDLSEKDKEKGYCLFNDNQYSYEYGLLINRK